MQSLRGERDRRLPLSLLGSSFRPRFSVGLAVRQVRSLIQGLGSAGDELQPETTAWLLEPGTFSPVDRIELCGNSRCAVNRGVLATIAGHVGLRLCFYPKPAEVIVPSVSKPRRTFRLRKLIVHRCCRRIAVSGYKILPPLPQLETDHRRRMQDSRPGDRPKQLFLPCSPLESNPNFSQGCSHARVDWGRWGVILPAARRRSLCLHLRCSPPPRT